MIDILLGTNQNKQTKGSVKNEINSLICAKASKTVWFCEDHLSLEVVTDFSACRI